MLTVNRTLAHAHVRTFSKQYTMTIALMITCDTVFLLGTSCVRMCACAHQKLKCDTARMSVSSAHGSSAIDAITIHEDLFMFASGKLPCNRSPEPLFVCTTPLVHSLFPPVSTMYKMHVMSNSIS